MKIRENIRWTNTVKNHTSPPVTWFEPENLQDIITVIQEAESKNLKVKAVGSGHSFSDVALPADYLVDMSRFTHVQKADAAILKKEFANHHLVESEVGISIRELNQKLDAMGLALINMGGIDHQTLAGVIATATHGTGKDLPSFPGFVRSITLVAAAGKVYRIEPANGITNPAVFENKNTELVQDDHIFYSVLVSMGISGIMYSCVLEVVPVYYLRETKKLTNWEELKKRFLDGSVFSEGDEESQGMRPRSVSFLINPYEVDDDRHVCIVMRHYYSEKPRKWKLVEATRNIISSIFGNIPTVFFITLWLFRLFPQRSPKLIRSSLKGMKDEKFVHRSHKVLYQGFEFIKERAYDAEFAFDLGDIPAIVNTTEKLFEKAAQLSKQKIYQSSPIGIRFVQRSKAYMAPEYEKEVAYLDTPFLLGLKGSDMLLQHYQQVMLENGGIPHWGKTNDVLNTRLEIIEKLFPELPQWKTVIKKFNANGTFSNDFSSRLQLTE